jgi:hypothetical protein
VVGDLVFQRATPIQKNLRVSVGSLARKFSAEKTGKHKQAPNPHNNAPSAQQNVFPEKKTRNAHTLASKSPVATLLHPNSSLSHEDYFVLAQRNEIFLIATNKQTTPLSTSPCRAIESTVPSRPRAREMARRAPESAKTQKKQGSEVKTQANEDELCSGMVKKERGKKSPFFSSARSPREMIEKRSQKDTQILSVCSER